MKGVYKFNWDCGRMGDLTGLFIAEKKDAENMIGKEIDFGEVLGKHSEIAGKIEVNELQLLTDDQGFIETVEKLIGEGTLCGYNPLDYYENEDEL